MNQSPKEVIEAVRAYLFDEVDNDHEGALFAFVNGETPGVYSVRDPSDSCSVMQIIGTKWIKNKAGGQDLPREEHFGKFVAVRPGFVVYVSEHSTACGLLVRDKENFHVLLIQETVGETKNSFTLEVNDAIYNLVDRRFVSCLVGEGSIGGHRDHVRYAGITHVRWDLELKPWLDHWLPQ